MQSYKPKSHTEHTFHVDAPGPWETVVHSAVCMLAPLRNVRCVHVFSFASAESVCFVPPRESKIIAPFKTHSKLQRKLYFKVSIPHALYQLRTTAQMNFSLAP